jgi:hypothetical protein
MAGMEFSMRDGLLTSALAVVLAAGLPARASGPPAIETGFHLLYETRFEEARSRFLNWQKENPKDPLGHAWEAASYLFEEFYQQGVLSSQFFLDDKKLSGGVEGKPHQASRTAFLAACTAAERLGTERLATNPRDADALLALTVTAGMRADYASIIDKHPFESLKRIRESEGYAERLLAVKPDAADAYLALGAANYIISSLPAHKRFFLWLTGIEGDRELGMKQLKVAATQGDYLRPFAKILLALAALREGQLALARAQLEDLAAEFPQNPLFARELAMQRSSTPHRAAP